MWSLTATVNIPLFYKDKQRQGVLEAEAAKRQARKELLATEIMQASSLRENDSLIRSAGNLMKLYQEGLLPKARQDIQLSLSGYITGKVEPSRSSAAGKPYWISSYYTGVSWWSGKKPLLAWSP